MFDISFRIAAQSRFFLQSSFSRFMSRVHYPTMSPRIKHWILYQRRALSIESRYFGIPMAIVLRIGYRKTGLTTTKLATAGKPTARESTAITPAPEETRVATAKATI
jgi:hypothetical protein